MRKSAIAMIWVVIIGLLIGLNACGSNPGDAPPATSTAQALRAELLATQMAQALQATNQIRYISVTQTTDAFLSLLNVAKGWPVVLSDNFEQDSGVWILGERDSDLASINWEIRDSRFHWEARAKSGFVWWSLPDQDETDNFYLAVDVRQNSGPEDGEVGLVFRSDGDTSYYQFSLLASGEYGLFYHSLDGWEELIDYQNSPHWRSDQPNRLGVIAQDSHFLLFVNDQLQAEYVDKRLKRGQAGLIIGLSYPDEEGSWEFDNFEVRTTDQILTNLP